MPNEIDTPKSANSTSAAEKTQPGGFVDWDHTLVARCQEWPLPGWIDFALKTLVRLGDGWVWGAVALALYLQMPWLAFKGIIGQCLFAMAICLPIYWGVKLGVRRQRPFMGATGVTSRVPPMDKFSFPSGHVMNNLTVAMTLTLAYPRLIPLALGVPVALGLLRIRYGVHFFTDIAGGAVLGLLCSLGAGWLFPRLFT